ncbi:DNA ligase D, 3''-phosphoesterase domain protein [Legionella tucsonensis]|uniref:DNA ligase D, 3''-phosphoesterase domain protein n=1 Tax=Legionella tucsonensis TaxID=40335 RepID=A0A0W0ZQ86_9GAMM|nr:DNA polymerase ligase N-terminal domain-containing protein [Legionella tucsonensis]KTD71319.1 DNA ligase D, 3''-phosphoesterase domain protein [Legionella tucsonensis]
MSKSKHLKEYQQKRDFRKTKEPQRTTSKKRNIFFVIQKHDASHLHYDFSLQNDDALISWAIPKGISTAANKKRLAIRTEDHPLDYAKFEGIIPEG